MYCSNFNRISHSRISEWNREKVTLETCIKFSLSFSHHYIFKELYINNTFACSMLHFKILCMCTCLWLVSSLSWLLTGTETQILLYTQKYYCAEMPIIWRKKPQKILYLQKRQRSSKKENLMIWTHSCSSFSRMEFSFTPAFYIRRETRKCLKFYREIIIVLKILRVYSDLNYYAK